MHRTDAPDFESDIGNGNQGFKETPPGNETIVAANFMNAVQEEIADVIEKAGLTLRSSGADDASNLWGQLYPALQIIARRESIIVDATKFGLVTGSPAVGTNTTALNDAFAVSPFVYIPPGIYELNGTTQVSPPDGGMLFGAGDSSVIRFTDTSQKFNVVDKTLTFKNFKIDGFGLAATGFITKHTLRVSTTISRITFDNFNVLNAIAIDCSSDNDGIGFCIVDTCLFSTVGSAVAIGAATIQSANGSCNLVCTNSHFLNGKINILSLSTALRRFQNNRIVGLGDNIVLAINRAHNTIFSGNEIDVKEIGFTNSEGPIFENNILPGVNSNTIFTTNAFVNWRNNKDLNGKLSSHQNNINGGYARRELTSSKTITNSNTYEKIDWDNPIFSRVSLEDTYTKDTFWDAGQSQFDVIGLGNMRCRVNCKFITTGSDIDNLHAALFINETLVGFAARNALSGSGAEFTISTEVPVNVGDTLSIRVRNAAAANIGVSVGAGDTLAYVEVEGL